jgi:hypothetical protein
MFSILGFHTDESLEEYFVDESFVNESCDGVEKVVTLDTEIHVLPMPQLTATEGISDPISLLCQKLVHRTCQYYKKLLYKNQHLMLNWMFKNALYLRDQSLTSCLL